MRIHLKCKLIIILFIISYTWKYLDRTMTEKVLTPPESQFKEDNYALCCDLSNSGEIVVVGYRQGEIHMLDYYLCIM